MTSYDVGRSSRATDTNAAFDGFARAELPRLLHYATMLTGERDLAQDLVQDVMVKVHRHWSKVSAAEHPQRYVTRMVTHEFLSWRRRWSVRNIFATADIDVRTGDPGTGLAHAGRHTTDFSTDLAGQEDMWQRLSQLPGQQRAVLVLRYYEGLPDSEIADILGCATTTVRGYAHRALITLRLAIGDERTTESNEETR